LVKIDGAGELQACTVAFWLADPETTPLGVTLPLPAPPPPLLPPTQPASRATKPIDLVRMGTPLRAHESKRGATAIAAADAICDLENWGALAAAWRRKSPRSPTVAPNFFSRH
jgi:hypothetical protein